MHTEKFIYVVPNGDGRWQVYGNDGNGPFTEEVFPTRDEAKAGVTDYALFSLGWDAGSYEVSIDE